MKVTQRQSQTRLAQVIELVRRAQESKADIQQLADRVVAWFVPVVLLLAMVTLMGWALLGQANSGLHSAIAVLVVSCPCALGLATPAAVIVATGRGADPGERDLYRRHNLRPCLNSALQAKAWFRDHPGAPAAIQVNSGMNRLGMEADEFASLGPLPDSVELLMSHMGCADDPVHPLSAAQLAEFRRLTDGLGIKRSLSATAGLLLGADYHFDLARIGIGLYGGWPFLEARTVVTVEAPIIQIRELPEGKAVGYGATWTTKRPSRIATISSGYSDGLFRALSNGCSGYIGGQPVPFAGRVSMDLITLDVTDCDCAPGDMVEILGPNQSIDTLAAAAGTIGHEVLTSLGGRYDRVYTGTAGA